MISALRSWRPCAALHLQRQCAQSGGDCRRPPGAAEKYQLDQLKDLCQQQLINATDVGNAVDHLFLGDKYQAPGLRKRAMGFVVPNIKAVLGNPEKKQKLIDQPALFVEVTMAGSD
jgi:hypothetical protein